MKRRKEERRSSIREKDLHGQHFRQTKEVGAKESWTWLQKGELMKETDGMILAVQYQSLRTNAIKQKWAKTEKMLSAGCVMKKMIPPITL